MDIIFRDIWNQWTDCWQGTVIVGVLFMLIGTWTNRIMHQHRASGILFFVDGVFLYFLLYVTLLSRTVGSRQEVELLPFVDREIISGYYYYLAENILLFIPFGYLLCRTLCAYGRRCGVKIILLTSFMTSVSVELLQYLFSCGKSEIDDVLANVLGAVLGYIIVKWKKC